MGIARSTFYDKPAPQDDTAIVEVISGICEEFEFYGWRRVRAEPRHRGLIVNHKKVRRLMREHDLQPRRRRRYVATTDSDHDQPIYPNRAKDLAIDGPDQLWVADITYVAIREGFAYVAVILDAWSRRAIGHAISRRQTSFGPMERPGLDCDCRFAMSRVCAKIIGLRIHIFRFVDASGRCNGSNRPDQRNGSCLFTPPSRTPSTSNAILFPATRSAPSEAKPSGIGGQRPRLESKPSSCDFPSAEAQFS